MTDIKNLALERDTDSLLSQQKIKIQLNKVYLYTKFLFALHKKLIKREDRSVFSIVHPYDTKLTASNEYR